VVLNPNGEEASPQLEDRLTSVLITSFLEAERSFQGFLKEEDWTSAASMWLHLHHLGHALTAIGILRQHGGIQQFLQMSRKGMGGEDA
jgi:hypothetical protein